MRIRLIRNENESVDWQKISKRRSLLAKIVNKIVFDGITRQNGTESSEAMKEVVSFNVWWTITGCTDYM
jgi:hypothetical protein